MKQPLTIAAVLRWAQGYLALRGVPSPYLDAEYMLAHVLACDRKDLLINPDRFLQDNEMMQFKTCLHRRGRREPLQYITGEVEFRGLLFKVNKNVLIPRPETELLVDEVAGNIHKKETIVLDLCTGSGCIAVCIAKEIPDCNVIAVDISEDALAAARYNAEVHRVEGDITFIAGDLFSAIAPLNLAGKIDIIVSNPPYVSEDEMKELQPEIRDYEPETALYGGQDGLDFYRRIIHESPLYLSTPGSVILEIGYRQADMIKQLFNNEKVYENIECRKDLNGNDRIVRASYSSCR